MASAGKTIGFIGAGMMASSLMRGFVAAGQCSAARIVCYDMDMASRERFREEGARPLADNAAVATAADVLFVAVKPNVVPVVLKQVAAAAGTNTLVVSIAAGVTIAALEANLQEGARVVRVMPNTPCSVGQCAAAFVKGSNTTSEDMDLVQSLLSSVGLAVACQEKDINAVTGLSGSGPAYGFLMIESMADGGVRAGLSRDVALKLAAQTLKGAAEMVLKTGTHPGVLKDQVCSPGGTTIAGVEALEKGAFRATVMGAVTAAAERADELSRM